MPFHELTENVAAGAPTDHGRELERALSEYVVLRRRECGDSWEGRVTFGLTAVSSRAYDERASAMAIASLREGQSLTFTFVLDPGPDAPLRVAIDTRVIASSAEAARADAADLSHALLLCLDSQAAGCEIVPAVDMASGNPDGSSQILAPAGVTLPVLPRRPVGFLRDRCGATSKLLLLDYPSPGALEIDHILTLLRRAGGAHRLSLLFEAFRLSADDVALLSQAAVSLDGSFARALQNGDEGNLAEAEDVMAGLRAQAAMWAREPRGVRTKCVVVSRPSLSSALLALATVSVSGCIEALPETPSVITRSASSRPAPDNPVELDLRGCVNRSHAMPNPLPSFPTLAALGVRRRFFSVSPIELAEEGVALGIAGPRAIRFAAADRARHCFVCGATGTGKSTLIENMIAGDLDEGHGVCLLDPHGDLCERVLRAIPPERIDDVMVIDPGDRGYAAGLNFLECDDGDRRQITFISNEIMKVFDRLYDLRIVGGPMFEQYMRNALMLVMDSELPGGSLMDVPLVFEDDRFRERLKNRCRDAAVVRFWNRQAERAGGEASLANMAPYVTSKLNQFTSNAVLRPIMGQARSTIDFRAAMDEGRIVLINLSKGALGELDSRLLGTLITGKILTAALRRRGDSKSPRPFTLYLDEFQNFTTDTAAHMLSELRKYGLQLVLATQTLSQLAVGPPAGVLEAVLGNCGSLLLFRLGVLDAERLQAYVRPQLCAADLQELADYHVAARLMVRNAPSPPFVFRTLEPPAPRLSPQQVEEAVRRSRERYARPVEEVEAALAARSGLAECGAEPE